MVETIEDLKALEKSEYFSKAIKECSKSGNLYVMNIDSKRCVTGHDKRQCARNYVVEMLSNGFFS